jgi:hypothetical protein
MPTKIQAQNEGPLTFEKVWEMFQETDREMKEMAREADRKWDEAVRMQKEMQKEAVRMQKEMQKETVRMQKEMQKETVRMQKETARIQEETDRQIQNVSRQLGGMANSDGDAAEELFATSLESKMMFAGQHYDAIEVNVKRTVGDLQGEFDIVLYNNVTVAIIEVKHKACQADLEKLVAKQLPNFRALYPQYRNHAVYLGIGGMSFDDRVYAKAHELGIGILRQKGDTIEADTGHIRAY